MKVRENLIDRRVDITLSSCDTILYRNKVRPCVRVKTDNVKANTVLPWGMVFCDAGKKNKAERRVGKIKDARQPKYMVKENK